MILPTKPVQDQSIQKANRQPGSEGWSTRVSSTDSAGCTASEFAAPPSRRRSSLPRTDSAIEAKRHQHVHASCQFDHSLLGMSSSWSDSSVAAEPFAVLFPIAKT